MYRTVVVGTDGSKTASEAVGTAAEMAALAGATLVIVSAYRPIGEDKLRTERAEAPDDVAYGVNPTQNVDTTLAAAAEIAAARGVGDVRTLAVDGAPADALLEAAESVEADLLVVGSQGMVGAKRFLLGSVPNRVSHHAGCDVLIVKTDYALGPG